MPAHALDDELRRSACLGSRCAQGASHAIMSSGGRRGQVLVNQ